MHLVVDGTDGPEHRGLLVLSALTFVSSLLHHVQVTVLSWNDPVIDTAVQALSHDSGLNIRCHSGDDGLQEVLRTASLYVCVVFRDRQPTAGLLAAQRVGTPILMPVQFPREDHGLDVFGLVRAAHDPRVLGSIISDRLERPS